MNADAVFELLIEANPIPDPDVAPSTVRALDTPPEPGSSPMLTLEKHLTPSDATPPDRRRWLAVAAVAATVVAVVAVVVLRDDAEPVEPSTPIVTVGETLPEPLSREEQAIETAREFLAAINAGDVDTAASMSNGDYVDIAAAREMWSMNAAISERYGEFQTIGRCEVANVNSQYVEVDCDVVVNDPVYAALDSDELVAPTRVYDDRTVVWAAWRGADTGAASAAYREYLQEHHADEYAAVCDPLAYEQGSVIVNRGLALTEACGELMVPLADDVAAWIEAGRP